MLERLVQGVNMARPCSVTRTREKETAFVPATHFV